MGTLLPLKRKEIGNELSLYYTRTVNQPWGTFTVNVLEKKNIFFQTISKTKQVKEQN